MQKLTLNRNSHSLIFLHSESSQNLLDLKLELINSPANNDDVSAGQQFNYKMTQSLRNLPLQTLEPVELSPLLQRHMFQTISIHQSRLTDYLDYLAAYNTKVLLFFWAIFHSSTFSFLVTVYSHLFKCYRQRSYVWSLRDLLACYVIKTTPTPPVYIYISSLQWAQRLHPDKIIGHLCFPLYVCMLYYMENKAAALSETEIKSIP